MRQGVMQGLAGHFASPLGTLTVLEGPCGVFCVSFGRMPDRTIEQHMRAMELECEEGKLSVFEELARYFDGKLRHFTTRIDLGLTTAFRRRTLEELLRVPYGTVVSYGELARRLGKTGAARAVGGAMRTNPIPILVPCHRVIAHDGSLGGFSAGLAKKRALHRLEGIVHSRSRAT